MSSSAVAADYVPIRTGSLIGDRPTTFNTYVKVGTRFVLYCRNGDVFDMHRLSRLQSKKIPNLYILKNDQLPYHSYLQQNVEAAYGGKDRPIEERALVIVGYNAEIVDRSFRSPENIDAYEELKSSAKAFEHFVCDQEPALKALWDVQNSTESVAIHGVRVGALAVDLAQSLDLIDGSRPIALMALGAFLHDIEHAHSEFDFRRPVVAMTKDEATNYKRHPQQGAERIQALGHIDALVKNIVLLHEEHIDGSGFPRGLKEADIDPLVTVVAVANAFDRLTTFEKLNPKDALKSS